MNIAWFSFVCGLICFGIFVLAGIMVYKKTYEDILEIILIGVGLFSGVIVGLAIGFITYNRGEKTELLSSYELISEEDSHYIQLTGGEYSSARVLYTTDEGKFESYNVELAEKVHMSDSNPRIETWKYEWGFLKYEEKEVYLP